MLSLISTVTTSYPPHPDLRLVVAAIFLAMVLAALPVRMSHIWVDSLCSPGLVH